MTDRSTTNISLAHSATPVIKRDRLLRLVDVENLTGLKRSSIYEKMKKGSFPKQISLSRRLSVWPETEVLTWIQQKIKGRAA